MSTAYVAGDWAGFALAITAAAATLAGLLFVAVSINCTGSSRSRTCPPARHRH
jgi:hypothetical protein